MKFKEKKKKTSITVAYRISQLYWVRASSAGVMANFLDDLLLFSQLRSLPHRAACTAQFSFFFYFLYVVTFCRVEVCV